MGSGRAAGGTVGQAGREAVVAAWGSVSGVFLTSGSALQDWAWGRRAGSAGMLKPLASSRAASSVSCGQGEEVQLPTPGSPANTQYFCALWPELSTHLPLCCPWLLIPHLKGPGAGLCHRGRGAQLEQELHSD